MKNSRRKKIEDPVFVTLARVLTGTGVLGLCMLLAAIFFYVGPGPVPWIVGVTGVTLLLDGIWLRVRLPKIYARAHERRRDSSSSG